MEAGDGRAAFVCLAVVSVQKSYVKTLPPVLEVVLSNVARLASFRLNLVFFSTV